MKYVRTKDGKILDTEFSPKAFKWDWNAKFIIDDNNLIVYDTKFKDRIANHGQILKQADTIEELCDEFVFIGQDDIPILMDNLQECFDRIEDLKLTNYKIYAAIWTSKGLIYVAKLNDEGDLELL